MDIRKFFTRDTFKVSFPLGKTILFALPAILLILLLMEALLRVIPIPSSVFVSTYDRTISYQEMDIKFSRLSVLERDRKVDCLLVGNSMTDYSLYPAILNTQPLLKGERKPTCFNMAFEFMMPETSSEIAAIFKKRLNPALIILGTSPVDFATTGDLYTRNFIQSPWFKYQKDVFTPEGWLIENSYAYRYWLSFLKYRDPGYRSEMANMNMLVSPLGNQVRQRENKKIEIPEKVKFPNFVFNDADLAGFKHILDMNSPQTQVVVVEMPVHPEFLHNYMEGGIVGYEEHFIKPIQLLLDQKGIPFIRTQPWVGEVVPEDGWMDFSHTNEKGAHAFSAWVGQRLAEINNPALKYTASLDPVFH